MEGSNFNNNNNMYDNSQDRRLNRSPDYGSARQEQDPSHENLLGGRGVYQDSRGEYDLTHQMYIRIVLIILSIILLTVVSLSQSFLLNEKVACMEDRLFDLTEGLNSYFAQNDRMRDAFLIICGLLMDIMVLTQFYRFARYGTSWRLPIAMFAFYIFRALVQQLFWMRYPDGYLWDFPGFYSITVPYGKTNDFFFSGHIGCCVIQIFEFKANNWNKFAYFSLVTCALQFALMICLRGHYFIDLVSGIVFGHYFWMLAEKYSYLVDVYIFRIPFHKRFPYFSHACGNCQHPIQLWATPHSENHYLRSAEMGGLNINSQQESHLAESLHEH
ncbi:UNKNOWN [Stylonychia lemnae]|uniref:AtPDCT1/2 transmembrane domain-containing protein n=1 Tax=Stylonychia lemnae TaxID=5949 RepID=A0A077ZTM7_STYLE|nr:UNKNOWN [Stylonychia lemnae]|eukprot:CDW72690.1 UNKNOWN [Stylonychia lemnae]